MERSEVRFLFSDFCLPSVIAIPINTHSIDYYRPVQEFSVPEGAVACLALIW